MKIGIMQPYFFPYLGYWQLVKLVDKYVIYDDVNYIKNGWINRNNILLNGKAHLITLPLEGASAFKPINQVNIVSDMRIKDKLLKTIEQAYKKAPFFNQVFPMIQSVVLDDSLLISKALEKQFRLIVQYLNIKTQIVVSSQIEKDNSLKGQEKVIDICLRLGGTEYVNAIGGQTLYSVSSFQQVGVVLHFVKTHFVPYCQFKNPFVPGLSIIDVMMFNSPEEINKMLDNYELI
ncbi:WbqC family protein [Candidatus Avelusimicrobium caledoniensis]|uniref:WbqC family protein n=1 Tax=Candidatus Avelusimicrobium caledoniensis TaxID=3416220 RepID=UPI003D124FB7